MKNHFIVIIWIIVSSNANASQYSQEQRLIDNSTQTPAWTTDALIKAHIHNEYHIKDFLDEFIKETLDTYLPNEMSEYELAKQKRESSRQKREKFIKSMPNCCRKGWCENIDGENCCNATMAMPSRLGCMLKFPCFYSRYITMKNQQTKETNDQFQCLDIYCNNNIGNINCCAATMLIPCAVVCIPCLYTDYVFIKNQNYHRYSEFYDWS
ncbi:hypothetical protein [Candidatus Chromulinivorax destructor]|uniref:Uncharacterized protein n=1 Tax=Candidatus Chromulinivorax destructor TaxID=2066483 RepID=A0A345ZC03_9BACT|nr:hypothetical protein [Candidatus Chromulinivorax destructor]AXK60820.1 hypothetical protein C0J27_03690 [Candidatus Chromulinivorax destructor]